MAMAAMGSQSGGISKTFLALAASKPGKGLKFSISTRDWLAF